MKKYRFFGNKLAKSPDGKTHPSIDLGFKNGKWENVEVTSSPTKGDSYTEFDDNPNPKWRGKNEDGKPIKRSFFRRYVRKDPKYAKLNEYKDYSLTEMDTKKVDDFLKEREKNILLDKQRRKAASLRKQQKMMLSYGTINVVVQLVDTRVPRITRKIKLNKSMYVKKKVR